MQSSEAVRRTSRGSIGCVAHSALLLKPNIANVLLFNFCEQKFIQHGPITIAIDCNGLILLIFEEKWLNYGSVPKSALNSDSFWVHRLFNVCVRVLCAPNATILLVYILAKIKMSFIWKDDFFFFFCQNRHLLKVDLSLFNVCVRVFCAPNSKILLVYIPAKIKMSFIWKDDFFFVKTGVFCKSIADSLPSVVQAHTQPYSFGGRIKLIICQIRHELSVTIHEISTGCK